MTRINGLDRNEKHDWYESISMTRCSHTQVGEILKGYTINVGRAATKVAVVELL